MIVIKPVAVAGANFISSTIAEPDTLQNEIEWVPRISSRSTTHDLEDFVFAEGFFWAIVNGQTDIYKYTESFVFIQS